MTFFILAYLAGVLAIATPFVLARPRESFGRGILAAAVIAGAATIWSGLERSLITMLNDTALSAIGTAAAAEPDLPAPPRCARCSARSAG